MRNLFLLVVGSIALAWFPTARAAEMLQSVSWSDLSKAGVPLAGEVLPADPPGTGEILKIDNPNHEPRHVELFAIASPGVTTRAYAVRGKIRYDNMKGKSYLEMWSHFPGGGCFFSRTLGEAGLMQHLEGTSGWRDFTLPFSITQSPDARPERLVVNLVFEGSGTVYLGPVQLVQYDRAAEMLRVPGAWWDERTGGLIGGILGGVLGCLGGLLGALAGRGRARVFVMELSAAVMLLGLGLVAVGATALLVGQPYEVWFPILLGGVISAGVFGGLRPTIRRRYEQWELDQMSAVDLGNA